MFSKDNPRRIEVIRGLGMGGAEVLLTDRLSVHNKKSTAFTTEVISTSPRLSHYNSKLTGAGVKLTATRSNDPIMSGVQVARLCLQDRGPRVYIVHSPGPLVFLKILKFVGLCRSPIIQVVHSAKYRLPYKILSRLTNWLSRGAIAVSEDVRLSAGCFGLRNCEIVYGGVDTEEMSRFIRATPHHRDKIRRRLCVPDGVPLFVSVGRLVTRKGHSDLIRALHSAESSAHLAIIGDGPEMSNLASLVKSLNMSDRIHLVGQQNAGWQWILASDTVCHTSHAEGLPVVVMETLALGVPLLATDFSGALEADKKSPNLITLVPTHDINAIARELSYIDTLEVTDLQRLETLRDSFWTVDRFKHEFDQSIVSIMGTRGDH